MVDWSGLGGTSFRLWDPNLGQGFLKKKRVLTLGCLQGRLSQKVKVNKDPEKSPAGTLKVEAELTSWGLVLTLQSVRFKGRKKGRNLR